MAIGFRAGAQVFNSTTTTVLTVPMPAGLAVGDRVLVGIGTGAASPTITDPTGSTWVKLGERQTGTQLKTAVYYRDIVGGEAASYTWGFSTNGRCHGYALAYSGCDLAVPPSAGGLDDLDAVSVATPAFQLADADWFVTFAAGRQSPGTDAAKSWTISDGSDLERYDLYSAVTGTSAKYTAAAYDSNRALAAGSGQRTVTANLSMSQIAAWGVRLAAPVVVAAPTAANPWSFAGIPQRA